MYFFFFFKQQTFLFSIGRCLLLQHPSVQTPRPHHASIVLHPRYGDRVRVVVRRVHGSSSFAAGCAAQGNSGAEIPCILGRS